MTYVPPDPPSAYAIPPFAGEPGVACAEADPEIFFPAGYTIDAVDEAKAWCRACPFRDQCLDFALSTEQRFGVWGATTPDERKAMREARGLTGRKPGRPVRAEGCGTDTAYRAHRRAGEGTCEPCLAAHSAYVRERYRTQRRVRP